MMKQYLPLSLCLLLFQTSVAQNISVTVDPSKEIRTISPYIYGINNNVSDDPAKPTSAATWKKFNDAGVRIYRENGGNNCTKYNWKRKLTSHPDWYNNVYSHDWDYAAASILEKTNAQAFFGLQLLGKAASNKNNNFNDWDYNQSQWWNGTTNNWAGGGGPSGDGNSDLYLKDWPADSTAGILDHWLNNLQYDPERIKYWNMDNEPEIWQHTHDDVDALTAQEYVQRYIAVAKAARKNFPDIKLVGPASPNEWQWYTWNNVKVTDTDGKDYPWMEYFIKKIAEEQAVSGVRLLDVLDVHFYPNTKSNPDLTLQLHRIWFDKGWDYSGANGVKVTGTTGWDNTITKEYFFERCNAWLTKYIGANHSVSFGISEYGAIGDNTTNPNIISCWYASQLGTFAANNVELFTPWDWYNGQWEVMHLFSNYYGQISTEATSGNEQVVSAYSSISKDKDSLMVVVVNRDRTNARNVDLSISNFTGTASVVNGFQLANLPASETFISKSNNALEKKDYSLTGNKLSFSAPSLSVTLFQIPLTDGTSSVRNSKSRDHLMVYPNPSHQESALRLVSDRNEEVTLTIKDMSGRVIFTKDRVKTNEELNIDQVLPPGLYMMELENEGFRSVIKVVRN